MGLTCYVVGSIGVLSKNINYICNLQHDTKEQCPLRLRASNILHNLQVHTLPKYTSANCAS